MLNQNSDENFGILFEFHVDFMFGVYDTVKRRKQTKSTKLKLKKGDFHHEEKK